MRPSWKPVTGTERYTSLDLLRGFGLFGVLLVNLLYFFRESLFSHILNFHSHPGWLNHGVDLLVTGLIEFKAFDLFSLTFGIGVAIQAERAGSRSVGVGGFLLRRFLILLTFGVIHLVLISNVDILTLYAVCGLMLIPLLRLPVWVLAAVGLAAVYLPPLLPRGPVIPPVSVLQAHAAAATRAYSEGTFREILGFRCRETQEMIAPLLIASAQKTLGLMLLGIALWRADVIRRPQAHRLLLWTVCVFCGTVGLINTTASVFIESAGRDIGVPSLLRALGSHVPLAFAYAAALLVRKPTKIWLTLTSPIACAGHMALTNYLAQSLAFGLVFYGYGFGLFGRLSPATAAGIGVVFYAAQVAFSHCWLRLYRFGPFEWVWRSMTYRHFQPMRAVPE